MVVNIRLFPPFSELTGSRRIQLTFDAEIITIKILLSKLLQEYPGVKTVLPTTLDENRVYGSLLPVRNNRVLLMGDEIINQDEVIIYGSISGG